MSGVHYRREMSEAATSGWHDQADGTRIAVVVLGCLVPVYDRAIRACRATWGAAAVRDVDVFYVYGNSCTDHDLVDLGENMGEPFPVVPDMEVRASGDILVCGCSDLIYHEQDALLRKRLLAFEYLLEHGPYDAFNTVCASSYVDQPALLAYASSIELELAFHGGVGICEYTGNPFVSGSSMLFSRDLVAQLVLARDEILAENAGAYADDVAIGRWIATNVCDVSLETVVERIRAGAPVADGNAFVRGLPLVSRDYQFLPAAEHVREKGAYHYHFATDRIEEMETFHRRWFGATGPQRPRSQ